MATELGKAYVQIMPSAKGISGSIQKTLDPEAKTAGKSAGSKIGAGLKLALVTATAAIGVTVGKVIADSISEGAKLQQSLGGVETLFKDSANIVKKYANEAYRTVGLSANEYMENVTGFSASLLQSMGGDTKKAAEIANMAMIDMGDNANKMGTDMRDIQNAYQGFAKQNYTMLDNLKLGYGGTKAEMERLLKDAEKLTGVKYDIDNLADVYSAIHAIQEELGITGTTALEANETFSGSFAAMAAAYQNVIGKLSIKEDVSEDLKALAQTISTFLFDNLVPMVISVLKALPGAIFTFIKEAVPIFLQAGKSFINNLTKGMSAGKLSVISTKINAVINAISKAFNNVVQFIKELWSSLVSLWNENSAQILATAKNVWNTIVSVIYTVVQAISDFVIEVWGSLTEWWNANGEMILQAAKNVWSFISSIISVALKVILGIFKVVWPIIKVLIIDTWNAIKNVIQGAIKVVTGIIQAFSALFTGNWSKLWDAIKRILSGAVQAIWGLVNLWFIGKVLKLGSTFINLFKGVFQAGWNFIRNIFTKALSAIVNRVRTEFNGIKFIVNLVMGFIRGHISTILTAIRTRFTNIFGALKNIVSGAFNGVRSAIVNGIRNAYNGLINFISRFKDAGRRIVTSIADGIKGAVGNVTSAITGVAGKIRNFLPFSPPKEGPLIDIMDVKWGETISAGILKGENKIAKAMNDVLAFDLTKTATFETESDAAATSNYKVLLAILDELRQLSDSTIEWNDRELGRLVRQFAR